MFPPRPHRYRYVSLRPMAQIQFFPETCLVATSVNPACVKPLGSEKIVGTGIYLSANATHQDLGIASFPFQT